MKTILFLSLVAMAFIGANAFVLNQQSAKLVECDAAIEQHGPMPALDPNKPDTLYDRRNQCRQAPR